MPLDTRARWILGRRGRRSEAGEAPPSLLRQNELADALASLQVVRGVYVFGTASAAPPVDW
jgi:hypothetical protein